MRGSVSHLAAPFCSLCRRPLGCVMWCAPPSPVLMALGTLRAVTQHSLSFFSPVSPLCRRPLVSVDSVALVSRCVAGSKCYTLVCRDLCALFHSLPTRLLACFLPYSVLTSSAADGWGAGRRATMSRLLPFTTALVEATPPFLGGTHRPGQTGHLPEPSFARTNPPLFCIS
jgi:hypothetical protein